jgi:transposase
MTAPFPPNALVVGIDVAKDKLDLARSDRATPSACANDAKAIATLIHRLLADKPALIVIEATGGLEQLALNAMLEAGLPAALVNPGQVRHFAQALGSKAKTDPIDARMIMEFGRLTAPRLAEKRSKNQTELHALITCRRQLVLVRAEQDNRLSRTASKPAKRAIEKVNKTLDEQINDLQEQIRRLIESDDDFDSIDKLLKSVPGVGDVCSATLLAELTELGKLGHKQLSALVGVAPFNRQSGTVEGTMHIHGGRASVRSALYMATVTAIRCNPVIKAFAQRLKDKLKPTKVVIVACMRKLLVLLNTMMKLQLPWERLNVVKSI